MAIFGSIHLLTQLVIWLVPSYNVRLVGFIVMGLCQMKNSLCYVWLFGLIRAKDNTIVCGIINAWDSITLTVLTVYFIFLSRSWFVIYLCNTVLGLFSLSFMLCVAPDNPKWLLAKG